MVSKKIYIYQTSLFYNCWKDYIFNLLFNKFPVYLDGLSIMIVNKKDGREAWVNLFTFILMRTITL